MPAEPALDLLIATLHACAAPVDSTSHRPRPWARVFMGCEFAHTIAAGITAFTGHATSDLPGAMPRKNEAVR